MQDGHSADCLPFLSELHKGVPASLDFDRLVPAEILLFQEGEDGGVINVWGQPAYVHLGHLHII